DAVDVRTGCEDASVPAVLLRGLPVEAADLVPGQVHLDDVLDRRVAEGDAGGCTEVPVGVRDADADVAAGAGCEPALAGAVTDVDELLLQIEGIHVAPSIRNRLRVLNLATAVRGRDCRNACPGVTSAPRGGGDPVRVGGSTCRSRLAWSLRSSSSASSAPRPGPASREWR